MTNNNKAPHSDAGADVQVFTWWQILGVALIVLFTSLAAVTAWLSYHPQHIRPLIEDSVSELIDRRFAINGEFDFSLGRIVTLSATDVSLQNAAWGADPNMLTLGEVEVSVDLFTLIDAAILVTNIETRDVEVLLEWNGDDFNWLLAAGDEEPDGDETDPPEPLPLIIGAAKLDNVALRVRNPALTEELNIVIVRGVHQQDSEHRLVLDIEAQLDNRPMVVEGTIGPFPELAVGGAVDFALDIQLPNATLRADGDFDWLARLQDPDFEINLHAPEAADLLQVLKLPPSTRGEVDVTARAVTEGEGIVASAAGHFGAVVFDARLDADSLESFEGFDLAVRSSGPSIRHALALAGVDALGDSHYELDILATRSATGLELSKLSFDTDGLHVIGSGVAHKLPECRDFNVELTASGEDYRILTNSSDSDLPGPFPFAVEVAVDGHGIGVDDDLRINATIGSLEASVTGTLTEDAHFSGSNVDIRLLTPDASNLASLAGVPLTRSASLDVTSRLNTEDQKLQIESLQVELDRQLLTASGSMDVGETPPGFDISGRVRGDDLERLVSLLLAGEGAPLVPGLAYDASATIRLVDDEMRVITERVHLGRSQLSFDGTVNLSTPVPSLDAEVSALGPDLTELLQGQDFQGVPALPFEVAASVRFADSALNISSTSLQFGQTEFGLNAVVDFAAATPAVTGTVSARGDNLPELLQEQKVVGIPQAPFNLNAEVSATAERVELSNVVFALENTTLVADLDLTLSDGPPVLIFDVEADGPDLRAALPETGNFYQPPALPFKLLARGRTDAGIIDLDEIALRLGDMNFDIRGELELEPQLAARGVRFNAAGPRLAEIGTVGDWQFKAQPFELSASMQGEADRVTVEDIFLRAGESELTGRAALDVTGKPNLQLDVQSKLINLDAIRTRPDEEESNEDTAETDAVKGGARLFSEDPLPFEKLEAFDGTFNIHIDELINRQRRFGNIVVEGRILDGGVDAHRIGIDAAEGRVRSNFTMLPGPDGMNLEVQFNAQQAMLVLNGMTAEEIKALPVFAVDAKLSATGNSPRQLASTMDGYVFAVGGSGSIKKFNLGPLMGDFLSELISTLNPFAKKETDSRISCSGLYFEIESGKVKTSPGLVFQSDKLTVLAAGKVDLGTEKIELTFETSPRKGVGISLNDVINPFVMVTGTLGKPAISLDPESTLIEGGTAVATAGMSIVAKSLWKRWISSKDACVKIFDRAMESRAQRDPANVSDKQFFVDGSAK